MKEQWLIIPNEVLVKRESACTLNQNRGTDPIDRSSVAPCVNGIGGELNCPLPDTVTSASALARSSTVDHRIWASFQSDASETEVHGHLVHTRDKQTGCGFPQRGPNERFASTPAQRLPPAEACLASTLDDALNHSDCSGYPESWGVWSRQQENEIFPVHASRRCAV